MKTSRATLLLATTALAGAAFAANEARAQQVINVSATVADACQVSTSGSMEFGEYLPGQTTALEGSTSFDVDCTADADVNIALDDGDHFTENSRGMLNGTEDVLKYELYTPGIGSIWGDDGVTHYGPSQQFNLVSGSNTITVAGLIAKDQNVNGGEYTDIVNISIKFN